MLLNLRCEDLVEGEFASTYVLTVRNEEELYKALIKRAALVGRTLTTKDIECVEVITYHSKVFVEGISKGSIAVNVNNNLPVLWVAVSVSTEQDLVDTERIIVLLEDWLNSNSV